MQVTPAFATCCLCGAHVYDIVDGVMDRSQYYDVRVQLSNGTKTRIPCCETHVHDILDEHRWEEVMDAVASVPSNAHLRGVAIVGTVGHVRRGADWGQDGEVYFTRLNGFDDDPDGTWERHVHDVNDGSI